MWYCLLKHCFIRYGQNYVFTVLVRNEIINTRVANIVHYFETVKLTFHKVHWAKPGTGAENKA